MPVTVTEKAAQEVQRTIAAGIEKGEYEEGAFLRISVAGGGCSGLNYGLKIDENLDESNDNVSEQYGVKVVVDKKSDLFLDGTSLDYYESLEKRGFQFHNPNATRTCGCGNSFST